MAVEDVPWNGLTAEVTGLKGLTSDSREIDGLQRLPGDEPGDAKGLAADGAASNGLSPNGCGAGAFACEVPGVSSRLVFERRRDWFCVCPERRDESFLLESIQLAVPPILLPVYVLGATF